jgi:hypothetical protein
MRFASAPAAFATAWPLASEELCRPGHAAAKKAGHVGDSFGRGKSGASRSRFGRGRRAALSLSLRSTSRRVVMKARVVRHHGARFRSAPLSRHITYLKRDGVTRDGAEARMFDAASDKVDERAFAERCRDDRHHFRFIIFPEDAAELGDLRIFTRADDRSRPGSRNQTGLDCGRSLEYRQPTYSYPDPRACRGRSGSGHQPDISRGFRDRAAERVTLELGPHSEQEIRSALEREVEAERWTSLDRALRVAADEGAGVADLRPSALGEDPELRRLMVGRAARLERLGVAEQIAPWLLDAQTRD